jgi:DNA polymerase-3 subunit delta
VASNRDDVPPDLFRLTTEIEKLAAAAAPNGDITQELVAELVPEAEGQNLWGLTNAISAGDAAAAVRELERALDGGAAPEALIGQLAAQFEAFAVVGSAPGGMDPATIATMSGLTEGRVRQTGRSARNFPLERTRQALNELRTLDLQAKQGQVEAADALVSVVARLATRR